MMKKGRMRNYLEAEREVRRKVSGNCVGKFREIVIAVTSSNFFHASTSGRLPLPLPPPPLPLPSPPPLLPFFLVF